MRISEFVDALEQDQFSQEFQLLGDSFDSKLNWIVGLYYFEEEGDNKNTLDFTVSNFVSGGFSRRVFPPQVAGATAPAGAAGLEFYLGNRG